MVIYPYKHSFAAQRLAENNFKIFQGKKRILLPPPEKIFEGELKTIIIKGNNFTDTIDLIKSINNYDDLLKLDYKVSARRVRGKYFKLQKVEYFLAKANSSQRDYGTIPPDHRIEYDAINKRLRIVGENSSQKWTQMPIKRRERATIKNPEKTYSNYLQKLLPFEEVEPEKQEIDEIAVMLSEDGRLICLKEQRDNPIICIAGSRRMGKTLLTHRLEDGIHHKWSKKLIHLNDPLWETETWCLTWEGITWKILGNLKRIGEISIPLPMVYLHPKTNTLKEIVHRNEVGFEVSLPFKDCILDYENTFAGSKRELAKSLKYLKNMLRDDDGSIKKGGLLNCKSYPEIGIEIDKEIPEKQELVRDTLKAILKDLCSQKVFDITSKVNAKWKLEFPDGREIETYPWTVCLMADLVPTIITSDLRTKDYYSQWTKFILDDLFKNQTDNEYFRKNRIELFIMIDEIQSILKNQVTADAISKIARESGMARIGMCYVPQNINQIPEDLSLVTNYIFAFNCKKEQATSLNSNFDMIGYKQKELLRLKKYEAILFTNDTYRWYDGEGNYGDDDEPVKGTIIVPNSRHKPPKEMREE